MRGPETMIDWERGAKLINDYRIVPRLILVVYYTFFVHAWYFIVNWFIRYNWAALPSDPVIGAVAVAAVAGFPAVILGILTKVLKDLTQSYWGGQSITHRPDDAG